MRPLFAIFLGWVILMGNMAMADDHLGPAIPKALGDPHPEGNAFMRINHMKLLRHDRDETVLRGDREIKFSLKECVACHVVVGPEALPISAENDQYFCVACHKFAAVKIDCFECHNSKPDPQVQIRLLGKVPDLDELTRYIEEVGE